MLPLYGRFRWLESVLGRFTYDGQVVSSSFFFCALGALCCVHACGLDRLPERLALRAGAVVVFVAWSGSVAAARPGPLLGAFVLGVCLGLWWWFGAGGCELSALRQARYSGLV